MNANAMLKTQTWNKLWELCKMSILCVLKCEKWEEQALKESETMRK